MQTYKQQQQNPQWDAEGVSYLYSAEAQPKPLCCLHESFFFKSAKETSFLSL